MLLWSHFILAGDFVMHITIRTNQLIGPALDWAVAKCEGNTFAGDFPHLLASGFRSPKYSTDWSQAGPIIEQGGISWHCGNKSSWHAYGYGSAENYSGPTPLIAAMRCYVASVIGDTVQIPRALAV